MKKYIIYLEDEPVQAKIFARIIKDAINKLGYELIVLNNGEDMENFLEHKEVSSMPSIKLEEVRLILLDLAIHDISGLQLLKEIQDTKINIPVAVLTAKEDKNIKKKALELGAIEYFIKGKSSKELVRFINFITQSTF